MSKEYFYIESSSLTQNTFSLSGDEAKHIYKVLRKKIGDVIWATDGQDTVYEAKISAIEKNHVAASILSKHRQLGEPEVDVTLAIGLLKNPARFDWIIEKGTEIGVRSFIPLTTERTIPENIKIERCSHLAIAAMKQSCRCYLPVIAEVTSLEKVVRDAQKYDVKIILHEEISHEHFVEAVLKKNPFSHSILFLIGPEGGFSEDEITLASQNGFIAASLGKRRLRTETAAIVAAALGVANR
jgi:16S rRNA (uracil1498-N3)-methyltransferase